MAMPLNQSPELTDAVFGIWQDIIEDRLGLQLPDHRRSFLKTCLTIRMREVGFDDYLAYYKHINEDQKGIIEWNRLMDRLTVQETRFFRDPSAFSIVKDHIRRRLRENTRPLSVWSVGCSTGEEPYSLAMLIEEVIGRNLKDTLRYGVTGSDISRVALEQASNGVFSSRKVDQVDSRLVQQYFESQDNDKYRVVQQVRDRTCFVRLNLLELAGSPIKNLDVIYCQNVLIYFRKWRRKDIVTELVERLSPGGMIVLGLGDMVDWSHPELTRVPGERVLAYLKSNKTRGSRHG